jgi:hypothetical protein
MPLSELFPCIGLSSLGLCAYNPAQPSLTYFTVGDAIAALGFTLAIQQLFKPIYLFRLRAYGLRIIYLLSAVFMGASCAIVAMVLPNLPISHKGILEYPIVWELMGGLLITVAYGIAAFISVRPARINPFNLLPFVRAALALLSAAIDDDRASFAEDVLRGGNIERLIGYASAWRSAEMHGAHVEFERLRAISAPLQITGPPPISAFYLFAHRRELEAGSHAGTLLRIMSDPGFCSTLVRKCSFLTASTLDAISKKHIHADQAVPFVQEIAHQAILHDESMLAREVSYTGFGALPILSNSLFGSWFILSKYDPLGGIGFNVPETPSEGYVARLNGASQMILKTAIKGGDYWPQSYMYSVQRVYEQLSRHWSYARPGALPVAYTVTLHMGIARLYRVLLEGLDSLTWERKKSLFITDPKAMRRDIVDTIASIVYESLACIANTFNGVDDAAWTHAISVFLDVYPPHESEPVGMNPLQQQLAVQLIDKLRHNMDGWYPAISRVLLATIGPYAGQPQVSKRTAYVILKDAVYKELQKLPVLHAKSPERVADFFPASVAYDVSTNTITHTYRGGGTLSTDLGTLSISDVDLSDQQNWQMPEPTAGQAAEVYRYDPANPNLP